MLRHKITIQRIICSILCFSSIVSLRAGLVEEYEKGLYFHSFTVDKGQRTFLNLNPEKSFSLKKGFSLSFEIAFRKEQQNFGYVFRIIANDKMNIDLVADIIADEYLFSLVLGDKAVLQYHINEFREADLITWMQVEFSLNPQTGHLSLSLNGNEKHADCRLGNLKNFDIFFGANDHNIFSTTDVCPMTIRNIHLYNEKQKEIRCWELGKHGIEEVYDICVDDRAQVQNPTWIIDSYVRWQKKEEFTIPVAYPQIAHDDENGKVFIVKGNRVFIYDVMTEEMDTIDAVSGLAYNCEANQLVYDRNRAELVSYDFDSNVLSRFNFQEKRWTNNQDTIVSPYFWHHSKQFIPEENAMLTVGGYGYHRYKGDLMLYSFLQEKWEKLTIPSLLSPRYLGSMGNMGDGNLLYFGGLGNESGRQEEFPKNYYDLFKIDIRQKTITKLWSLPDTEEHYTNANSLVINKENGVFYTLTYQNKLYNTNIQLYEFGIDQPVRRMLADTIPYTFNDIESYCDLFLCPKISQLIAVTSHYKNDSSKIGIYTIKYRPLAEGDVLQTAKKKQYGYLYFALSAIVLLLLFFIRRKMKYNKKSAIASSVPQNNPHSETPVFDAIRPSSVNLLGNFQVIDNSGIDITGHFTPTTNQIFLLCLLATIKNGKGVSSGELRDILWYDKDNESARNNRNVNVSKLRVILKNIGNIEIANNNSYWSVTFGNEIFCDYKRVLSLAKRIEQEKATGKVLLNELLNLASKGVLLPNMQLEWLDVYKAEYSDLIIEKLLRILEREDVKADLALVLKIANIIFLHDSIDEDALAKKCHALYYLGKKRQARQCFEKFVAEYKYLLGTEYKYSFDQFREKYLYSTFASDI
jgi:DNA-binding SARP family transcriptional activator